MYRPYMADSVTHLAWPKRLSPRTCFLHGRICHIRPTKLFSVRGRGFIAVLQNWPLRQIGLENGLKSHASLALNAGLAHLKTRGGLG
jgi:hypothetical protein